MVKFMIHTDTNAYTCQVEIWWVDDMLNVSEMFLFDSFYFEIILFSSDVFILNNRS